MLTITASGSVSDYADTSSLRQKIANAAGLEDASLVTISVAPASVIITATIAVPATNTAAAVQSTVSSNLGTTAAASTALGIPVEAVPTIAVQAGSGDGEGGGNEGGGDGTPVTTNPTSPSPPPPTPSPPPPSPSQPPPSPSLPPGSPADSGSSDSPPGATGGADDGKATPLAGSGGEMNIEGEGGGGGPPTAAIGGGAAVAILLMVGLGFLYLRKKRMAGSQSPVALTAISLTPTKKKDLESGSPATKGPAASGKTTTYSVELAKTPLGLGLSLTDDTVTEIKPDSQAARGGRIKEGHRRLTLTLTRILTLITLTLTLTRWVIGSWP